MEDVFTKLHIVYWNYYNKMREFERFYKDISRKKILGIESLTTHQNTSKLAAGFNRSEENADLDLQHECKLEKSEIQCKLRKKKETAKSSHKDSDLLVHLKTKVALENAKIQIKNQNEKILIIQTMLRHLKEKVKSFQNKVHTEESAHLKTREALENALNQKRAQEEKNIQIQNQLRHLRERIKQIQKDLHLEKLGHQKTKEELLMAKSQGRTTATKLNCNQPKKKKTPEREHVMEIPLVDSSKELETAIEALKVQLQQTKTEKRCLKENYKEERATHQVTKEQLERANNQIKGLSETCEEMRNQLMDTEKKIKEGLLTCMSVISDPNLLQEAVKNLKNQYSYHNEHVNMNNILEKKYKLEINDLRAKLENCTALLDASMITKSRLEGKLSNMDTMYAIRERKYVKLINMHIVLAHHLKKKLRNHISKCKRPIQHKVCSWINENILQNPTDTTRHNKEPPNVYPHDWRLPGIPGEDLW